MTAFKSGYFTDRGLERWVQAATILPLWGEWAWNTSKLGRSLSLGIFTFCWSCGCFPATLPASTAEPFRGLTKARCKSSIPLFYVGHELWNQSMEKCILIFKYFRAQINSIYDKKKKIPLFSINSVDRLVGVALKLLHPWWQSDTITQSCPDWGSMPWGGFRKTAHSPAPHPTTASPSYGLDIFMTSLVWQQLKHSRKCQTFTIISGGLVQIWIDNRTIR